MTALAADRVFVPAVFAGRLAHMPARTTARAVRVEWLTAQLAELTCPAVLGTVHGLEALRLASQLHRELSALSMSGAVSA